jgi:hypothetical protein
MKLSRRTTVRMLAGVAASAAAQLPTQAQIAAPAADSASAKPSGDLAAAREGLQEDTRRVSMVKLPHATEPAFQFRV